nr:ulp1 protease family, C-terminal catalytic domain-containing protein [Ipomoea batatas]
MSRPTPSESHRRPAEVVHSVRGCLCVHSNCELETELASQIREVKPKRMQMLWRVARNQVDSAVYTMLHMELYCC